MTTQPDDHPGQRHRVLLRFINPPNGNRLLNDTPAGGPALETGLKAGDGIMSVLGKAISPLELGRMMQSANDVSETKDETGRVYRLRMKKAVNEQTFQNRLGLLEDGVSWALMDRCQLFDEIDPGIHASVSLVRLQGVCLRSVTVAAPARHFSTPVGHLGGSLSSLRTSPATETTIEVTPKSSDAKTGDYTSATSGSGSRSLRKRKPVQAANESPLRNISRKRRRSRRTTISKKSYKEQSHDDESTDDVDMETFDDIVLTPQRPRNRPMSDGVYTVLAHESQDELAEEYWG